MANFFQFEKISESFINSKLRSQKGTLKKYYSYTAFYIKLAAFFPIFDYLANPTLTKKPYSERF